MVLISGCWGGGSRTKSAQEGVDALIVSVEEVRHIASADDLAPHKQADLSKPPPADANAPGPCRAVGHNDLTFGSTWSEFRSAGYHGVTDDITPGGISLVNGVTQAVAHYPNSGAASDAFHHLDVTLQACANLHDPNFKFTLERPDPSTLRITAEMWSHLYRQKSDVLVSVGVVGLEVADQIANNVLQIITDRIK